MQNYTITWHATLGRALPDISPLRFDDVQLRRRAGLTPDIFNRYPVELETTEAADLVGIALKLGRARIRTASAAFQLILKTSCEFSQDPPSVAGEDGTTLASLTLSAGTGIIGQPFSPSDVLQIDTAARSWSRLSHDERTRLALALRWRERANADTDPLDALMGAWIAFETVVKHGKRSGGKKAPLLKKFAIPELQRILPDAPHSGIEHLLREIYDAEHNEIIHKAKAELDDPERSRAAIALTSVVLENALGLPIDANGTAQTFLRDAAAVHQVRCVLECEA